VEGQTDDPAVNALRRRRKRSLLTMLLLSQGVPMLLAGDEMGRTQGGNNNAYCQDNAVSWMNWCIGPDERQLLDFVQRLIRLRRAHPVLRRVTFFKGHQVAAGGVKDIMWLRPDGTEMDDEGWRQTSEPYLGIFLAAEPPAKAPMGQPPTNAWGWLKSMLQRLLKPGAARADTPVGHGSMIDRVWHSMRLPGHESGSGSFLILVNAHHDAMKFVLPLLDERRVWSTVIDTNFEDGCQPEGHLQQDKPYALNAHSMAVLQTK